MKQHGKEKIKILASILMVLVLVVLVFNLSYALISDSIMEYVGVDKTTSNYISFNYVDVNDHIIEVDKPKILGDFLGKRMLKDDYLDFEVMVPEEYVKSGEINYEIVATDLGNSIDEKYVKFYLTDQNNDVLDGYSDVVPVYSVLSDTIEGKIIYSGVLDKNNLIDKYRLRIWISNAYKKEFKSILAYHLEIRIK